MNDFDQAQLIDQIFEDLPEDPYQAFFKLNEICWAEILKIEKEDRDEIYAFAVEILKCWASVHEIRLTVDFGSVSNESYSRLYHYILGLQKLESARFLNRKIEDKIRDVTQDANKKFGFANLDPTEKRNSIALLKEFATL